MSSLSVSHAPLAGIGDSHCERLAIYAIRRALCPFQRCPAPKPDALIQMAQSFSLAQQKMLECQGAGLNVAEPSSTCLTKHERRLLCAIAAAQSCNAALMDNYLFKLAPTQQARAYLAASVVFLAAGLAAHGYWI